MRLPPAEEEGVVSSGGRGSILQRKKRELSLALEEGVDSSEGKREYPPAEEEGVVISGGRGSCLHRRKRELIPGR
jgi:hypothetical protein